MVSCTYIWLLQSTANRLSIVIVQCLQLMSKKLPHTLENVCLSRDEECQMYAVGSKAYTDLLDSRTLQVNIQLCNIHTTVARKMADGEIEADADS